MPKKVFAVTNVKVGQDLDQFWAAGAEVDATKLTKAQLTELHDAGAVEVREVDADAPDPIATHVDEEPTGQTPGADDTSTEADSNQAE